MWEEEEVERKNDNKRGKTDSWKKEMNSTKSNEGKARDGGISHLFRSLWQWGKKLKGK